MQHQLIIEELDRNKSVFEKMLRNVSADTFLWKPAPEKWCLLEVVCHLHDEEREDFRARVKYVLEQPNHAMASINPVGWVTERKYIEQNYEKKLSSFLKERDVSIQWLQSLHSPNWQYAYNHPKLGIVSAEMFLANWLAHDYLHMRQITGLKHQYLKYDSGENLEYAGNW